MKPANLRPNAEAAPAAVLDWDHLARQTSGDGCLEAEVLALFESQCERLLPVLEGGADEARREAAHALRGAALAVGAGEIAALAGAIESGTGAESAAASRLRCAVDRVRTAVRGRRGAKR